MRGAAYPRSSTTLALLLWVAPLGCTLLVRVDPEAPAPCSSAGDCSAGFACVDGECSSLPAGVVPPASCGSLESLAWLIEGPGGVTLEVPEGALPSSLCVSLAAPSSSLVVPGFALVAAVVIAPSRSVTPAATLRFPVGDDGCAGGCTLLFRDEGDGAWRPVTSLAPDGGVADGAAAALIDELGLYALVATLEEPDAGAVDAGPLDAGALDGGPLLDGGASDTLFAACAFHPDECSGGETCVPDPFDPSAGRCLSSCAAGGAACARCGTLTTLAGEWCLPPALAGTAAPGATCSVDGDCDPGATSGCVAFDDGGARACALACTAADEGATCGLGCCALGERGGAVAGYCRPSSSCGAAPDGARCVADGACASGECASLDGVAAARCTRSCTLDEGCGAGLCCHPTGCDGAGQCVPGEVCAGESALFCDELCVDEAACSDADSFCYRGECTALSSCGCFAHEHCGASQFCLVDAPTASACTAGSIEPCCGACTAVPGGSCYRDGDCAGGELCALPPQCASDPFGQCAGACRALVAGECVTSADCEGGEACVDHRCL